MWRDPDDITADLASGDPARITTGVEGLVEFTKAGDEFPLPALGPDLLGPLGERAPDELVIALARLLARYRSFQPPPTREQTLRHLIELALRHGVHQVIYETAIELQGGPDPVAQTQAALAWLGARGLAGPDELAAAKHLVRYLLEAKAPVRQATVDALAGWPAALAQPVIDHVLGLLDSAQRTQLGR